MSSTGTGTGSQKKQNDEPQKDSDTVDGWKAWTKTDYIPRRFDELPPEPDWIPVADVIRTQREETAKLEEQKVKIRPPSDVESDSSDSEREASQVIKRPGSSPKLVKEEDKKGISVNETKHKVPKSYSTDDAEESDDDAKIDAVTRSMMDWALKTDYEIKRKKRRPESHEEIQPQHLKNPSNTNKEWSQAPPGSSSPRYLSQPSDPSKNSGSNRSQPEREPSPDYYLEDQHSYRGREHDHYPDQGEYYEDEGHYYEREGDYYERDRDYDEKEQDFYHGQKQHYPEDDRDFYPHQQENLDREVDHQGQGADNVGHYQAERYYQRYRRSIDGGRPPAQYRDDPRFELEHDPRLSGGQHYREREDPGYQRDQHHRETKRGQESRRPGREEQHRGTNEELLY